MADEEVVVISQPDLQLLRSFQAEFSKDTISDDDRWDLAARMDEVLDRAQVMPILDTEAKPVWALAKVQPVEKIDPARWRSWTTPPT